MGWFDCVATNYGCRLQVATDVAFTVLDALGYLEEIPVCVGYEIDGEVTTDFPVTYKLEKAKPVLKKLPGWKCDIRGIKKFEDLPENLSLIHILCGIRLPEGLKEADKLPEPIYTPSTKAEIGDHDENISYEQSVEYLEKRFPGKGAEYAAKLRDYTIAIYKKCADYALTKGCLLYTS